jgi:hypothetical protein
VPLINKNNTQSDIEIGSHCEWGARKIDFSFFSGIFIFSNSAAVNQSKSRKNRSFRLHFCVRQINDALSADKGPVFDARRRVRSLKVECALAHSEQRKCLSP